MSSGALSVIDWTPTAYGHAAGGGDATEHVSDVYHYAIRMGSLAPDALDAAALDLGLPPRTVFAAVAQLIELRLLRTDGGALVPVDLERAMYRQRDLADRMLERIGALAAQGARSPNGGAVDVFEGVAEIRGLLKLAADVCRHELVLLRPGHEDEALLDELFDSCDGALGRDVESRIVLPHRCRADFAARARVKRLLDGGAQIRTVSQVPQAAAVFDRELAVILSLPAEGGPAAGLPTARRIRDADVVGFLVDMVDQLWEGAAAFVADEPGYADEVADDLQLAIARLMAQGYTDEVVARRLGMSVRTCRRHIAALLRNLGSVSRFQAGVQAARRLTAQDVQHV
ncbi:MAG TPA: helix-turn-helix transcriptional regulator [Actinocrinis sp.]|jgi:DNA-binding CsgD family transcriptional regulator|uniref:helix-turn-helix transcriptional regulator n=1 Tax=Actinocrinis sp. TaxID=1920516 RepID=UPI002DDCB716|nr:helix-turn-helix transcriptional regulator [Actinocrinis sp.]HEV3169862.1 helix-turn-helix transcriptional regulator [Actinocrinis sp.]